MRVFVAGASGAIGRQLVPKLVAAGHRVFGMTRSERRLMELRAMGAEPVLCDVFDRERLLRQFLALRPEAVIAELTSLPQRPNLLRMKAMYRANNRVRLEGTANLIAAAREAGSRRLVFQSMAVWYAPDGAALRTESDPLYVNAPEPLGGGVRALQGMEQAVLGSGLEGILMRYGAFYGPGTWHGQGGAIWRMVKKRRFPLIGDGTGVYSWIQIEDAAAATVAALEQGQPGSIYNVVDDEPAPVREWLPAYAAAIGAPPPRHVPSLLAWPLLRTGFMAWERTVPGVSNARIVRELGWRPRWSSWREGFRLALGERTEPTSPRSRRTEPLRVREPSPVH